MGLSCCKIRHNTSTIPTPPLHPPRPPQPSPTPNHPSSSSSTSHHLPLPCPPPPSYAFVSSAPYPSFPQSNTHHPNLQNPLSYSSPHLGGQPNYPNQGTWQAGFFPGVPRPQPPLYVDHQNAKKIKNEVNVHKDTIKVELDEKNVGYHLVSFTFDALVDGSFTIVYFAKEGTDCTFTPLYPEIHIPVRVSFNKGLGQKFCQPPGTGIDLGFFDTDVLSNPSSKEDIFPLVISAQIDEKLEQPSPPTSPLAQITQAVLERNNENHFQVKVFKQILWVDRARYELREIYGISNSDELGFDENGQGKECVICMSEPKDTAILPCRHMCMCSGCAKELRLQSNKCPICRQPIHELIEIKVDKGSS